MDPLSPYQAVTETANVGAGREETHQGSCYVISLITKYGKGNCIVNNAKLTLLLFILFKNI